jgi:hypothetical protein
VCQVEAGVDDRDRAAGRGRRLDRVGADRSPPPLVLGEWIGRGGGRSRGDERAVRLSGTEQAAEEQPRHQPRRGTAREEPELLCRRDQPATVSPQQRGSLAPAGAVELDERVPRTRQRREVVGCHRRGIGVRPRGLPGGMGRGGGESKQERGECERAQQGGEGSQR